MLSSLQVREVFHFQFLHHLLRISDPSLYVLKGGVNLRFFFKSPRYSEDMDLDVLAGQVSTLRKNGYKVLADASFKRALATYGIESLEVSDPHTAKHTETTQRFKVLLITAAKESLPTKIEFSRRESSVSDSYETQRMSPEIAAVYQRLPFPCQHYALPAAVAQKIRALAGRELTQARDVFDLYILKLQMPAALRGGLFKVSDEVIEKARARLSALNYSEFEGHVLEFLSPDTCREFESKEAWVNLRNAVDDLLADRIG